ncbi:hypothetical protein TSMEX_004945 [Taenia solium]|eukprot:TsM_001033300 transcript=TsM_001033300 gene=TsM_001033300
MSGRDAEVDVARFVEYVGADEAADKGGVCIEDSGADEQKRGKVTVGIAAAALSKHVLPIFSRYRAEGVPQHILNTVFYSAPVFLYPEKRNRRLASMVEGFTRKPSSTPLLPAKVWDRRVRWHR